MVKIQFPKTVIVQKPNGNDPMMFFKLPVPLCRVRHSEYSRYLVAVSFWGGVDGEIFVWVIFHIQ